MSTETKAKHSPGPFRLELKQAWPFGFSIWSGDKEILQQGAYCTASGQKTRDDCLQGIGFPGHTKAPGRSTREDAARLNAEQDANSRLWSAAPDADRILRHLLSFIEEVGQGGRISFASLMPDDGYDGAPDGQTLADAVKGYFEKAEP